MNSYADVSFWRLELENLDPGFSVGPLAGDGRDVGPVEQVYNVH